MSEIMDDDSLKIAVLILLFFVIAIISGIINPVPIFYGDVYILDDNNNILVNKIEVFNLEDEYTFESDWEIFLIVESDIYIEKNIYYIIYDYKFVELEEYLQWNLTEDNKQPMAILSLGTEIQTIELRRNREDLPTSTEFNNINLRRMSYGKVFK